MGTTSCGRATPFRDARPETAGRRATSPMRLLVPAYFRPGPEWQVMAGTAGAVGIVILNLASGPGEAADDGYRGAVDALRQARVEVVGYVDTAYGGRDVATVLSEVAQYRRWYDVDGVFYDQVTVDCASRDYNVELADGARAQGCLTVVSNPGETPFAACECLMDVADVIVSEENDARHYLNRPAPPAWAREYDPAHFCHLVYGAADAETMRTVVTAARDRGAGWVFATSLPVGRLRSGEIAPHPWAGLPDEAYWAALLEAAGTADPTGG